MATQPATNLKPQATRFYPKQNLDGSISTRFVHVVEIPPRFASSAPSSRTEHTKRTKRRLEIQRIRRDALRNSRARSHAYSQRVRLSAREHRTRSAKNIRSKTSRLSSSVGHKVRELDARSKYNSCASGQERQSLLEKRRHSYPRYVEQAKRELSPAPKLHTRAQAGISTPPDDRLKDSTRPSRIPCYTKWAHRAHSPISEPSPLSPVAASTSELRSKLTPRDCRIPHREKPGPSALLSIPEPPSAYIKLVSSLLRSRVRTSLDCLRKFHYKTNHTPHRDPPIALQLPVYHSGPLQRDPRHIRDTDRDTYHYDLHTPVAKPPTWFQSVVVTGIKHDILQVRKIKRRISGPAFHPSRRRVPPQARPWHIKPAGSFAERVGEKLNFSKKVWKKLGKGKDGKDVSKEEKLIACETPSLLYCSVCTTLHGLINFIPTEHSTLPQRRQCSGSTSHLNICQHWRTSWAELRDLVSHPGSKVSCSAGHHGHLPSASMVNEEEVTIVRECEGEVVIRKKMVLAQFPSHVECYPWLMLQRRMEELEQWICPHIHLDIDGFAAHIASSGGKPRSRSHPKTTKMTCGCCNGIHHCPNPQCETSWWLYRRPGTSRHDSFIDVDRTEVDEVVLEVERCLGKMSEEWGKDGVCGERWGAQAVPGERKVERFWWLERRER
ncbi:hypothetical protein K458DRAFT_397273 [Lentithecium fluviatile CBS 122367]|uniref:Uncharacterized protein n=1 Tax=Lentithecium fluviatile CBS 122367 TaxID=1168545 RepID=A0A6G1IDF0_9PLEO|nr:hypothetical protein K458DRAFT_397273 [Lentithecium fluviatile CBS 122367]